MWSDFEKCLVGLELGRVQLRAGEGGAEGRRGGIAEEAALSQPFQELAFSNRDTWPVLGILGQVLCAGNTCRNFFLVGKMVFIF